MQVFVMDSSFLLMAGITIISSYLSLHSPEVIALLFFVSSVFGVLASFVLAPPTLQVFVLLAGLFWVLKLWRSSPKLI